MGGNQHEITAERLRGLADRLTLVNHKCDDRQRGIVLRGQGCCLSERATRSRGPVVHHEDVVCVVRVLHRVHVTFDPPRCETVR